MIYYCKDCKFAKVSWFDYLFLGGHRFAICTHPHFKRPDYTDIVTGKLEKSTPCCRVMRDYKCTFKHYTPKVAPND